MDLPIKLSFYRKLELYQELTRLNNIAQQNAIFNRNWKAAKVLLLWIFQNQEESIHPRPFTDKIFEIVYPVLEEEQKDTNEQEIDITQQIVKDLINRGYLSGSPAEVYFTKEGLLMGEVISDYENPFTRIGYATLYYVIWLAFLSGLVFVVLNTIKLIIELFA